MHHIVPVNISMLLRFWLSTILRSIFVYSALVVCLVFVILQMETDFYLFPFFIIYFVSISISTIFTTLVQYTTFYATFLFKTRPNIIYDRIANQGSIVITVFTMFIVKCRFLITYCYEARKDF